MAIIEQNNIENPLGVSHIQQADPIVSSSVDVLLSSKIVIAGKKESDVAFMKTMLQISGFTNIHPAYTGDDVMHYLRKGIKDDICDVDLVILDTNIKELRPHQLRKVMDGFDEWRLIPIISLTQESQWDHAQALTDLGHGVTSLVYNPLTAESFPPSVMTALAVKKERDTTYQETQALKDEVASLKMMEARLQFSVEHDDLTGLSNRRKLEQMLDISLIQSRNFNTQSTLFYVDLDRFKVLNDAEGHIVGDALLVQISNTFRGFFTPQDTIVRIGSDEFAILVDNIDSDQALKKAEELRTLLDGYSFEHMDNHYHLSASIGVKFITPDTKLMAGDVLAHANQACYTAKQRGRNQVHLYSTEDHEMGLLRHSVQWAPRIRAALKQGDFLLEFQPIYSVSNKEVSHYECLIRMRGEDNTIYYPNDFIPVAEAMGLIQQVDLWVVNHVFDIMRTMPEHLSFTMNLSGNIFLEQKLYPLVERKLTQTGVDPSRVVFEITETSAISNFEQTKDMVNRLRGLGCRFALDDFGAGFNSYSYLKHFPVDILKIDGGFIKDLERDPVDQLLVKSMVDVAHSLGKKTVAEYVEHQSTMDLLEELGVDYIQGFLVGKPQVKLL